MSIVYLVTKTLEDGTTEIAGHVSDKLIADKIVVRGGKIRVKGVTVDQYSYKAIQQLAGVQYDIEFTFHAIHKKYKVAFKKTKKTNNAIMPLFKSLNSADLDGDVRTIARCEFAVSPEDEAVIVGNINYMLSRVIDNNPDKDYKEMASLLQKHAEICCDFVDSQINPTLPN